MNNQIGKQFHGIGDPDYASLPVTLQPAGSDDYIRRVKLMQQVTDNATTLWLLLDF